MLIHDELSVNIQNGMMSEYEMVSDSLNIISRQLFLIIFAGYIN